MHATRLASPTPPPTEDSQNTPSLRGSLPASPLTPLLSAAAPSGGAAPAAGGAAPAAGGAAPAAKKEEAKEESEEEDMGFSLFD